MKKSIFLLMVMLNCVVGRSMVVFMNYGVFKNDDTSSYLELYLKIPLSSVYFGKTENNYFQASVNYEVKIKQNDSIVFYHVYNLLSPLLSDTIDLDYALLDLKRIKLSMGIYYVEIVFQDNFASSNRATAINLINTRFNQEEINFSDLELLDTFYASGQNQTRFSRMGYELIPNVFNTFTFSQPFISFYTELYNTHLSGESKNILIRYYLLKDSMMMENTEKIIRQAPNPVNYLLGRISIEQLTAGNYQLVVEAYSSGNQLITFKSVSFSKRKSHEYYLDLANESSKVQFAAMIKEYSVDELKKNISYLEIIGDGRESQQIKLLQKENDRSELENFLYQFWIKRDSLNPQEAWQKYLNRINDCNRQFTTMLREGYLTDRGRVYLEYGPPNSIAESSSSQLAYPYQIWHYYQLTENQQNKKFVFFNRTGALNEYELIHSNARGEVQNPRWREIISKYNHLNPNDDRFFGDFLDDDFNE